MSQLEFNRINICKHLAFLILPLFFISPVRADIVTLINGSEMFGEIISDTEKSVKLKTPAATLEFSKDRVIKVTKESPALTNSKFGKYYLDRKDYLRAAEYYDKAHQSEPSNTEYESKLAQAKRLAESTKSSEADGYLAAGDKLLAQERFAEAVDSYAKITTLNLGEAWNQKANEKIAHIYIIQANRALEQEKRQEWVAKALVLYPRSAEAHYEQGMIYLQKNQSEPAQKEFELSISFDPTFAKSHRILGNILYSDQKYLEASQHYEQVKKLAPDLFSGIKQNLTGAYLELGNQSYQNQKYDEAKLWLEKYLELDPSGNWTLLYQTQYQLKKMEIDPTSAEEHYKLGLWCQDKNLNDEALTEFKAAYKLDASQYKARRKVIELYDKFASSLYQTGNQSLNAQQYQQAIASYSKITADYPESSFAAEARRLISVAREQWSENLYALAKSNFEAGYTDRAYQGFTNIVQSFSDTKRFVDAQRMLARTKSKMRFDDIAGDDRKIKLDELKKIIDSSAGEDKLAWNRIQELQTMPQWDFEARLSNLTFREKGLVQRNLDRIIYQFYDPDKNIDKLRPIAMKYSLPVSDKSKVRSQQDYIKLLQFALLLATSIGDDYYNAWQELVPYFGTSRSELEDAKAGLSDDTKRLIEERGSEVLRILNLRSGR